jgi:D-tagatose 6-phosphate 4-epimerase
MTETPIQRLARERLAGRRGGVAAICTAHPVALAEALRHGLAEGGPVLIEATCNQVNQDGGYTGMRPADFRRLVENIAATTGFDAGALILGGDHLGPNPWRKLAAEAAMAKAEAMVAAYVQAGFSKFHLDASMGCLGEPDALADETTARRAARLAATAEAAAREAGLPAPVYVIGTEVPPPGGALSTLHEIEPTRPEAALTTLDIHRQAFVAAGQEAALERVIGLVVQPGVEFDSGNVAVYRRAPARPLSEALSRMPGLVFEAHSTDFQPPDALAALVADGFAILKVGPALTFALREALYGLDAIVRALGLATHEDGLAAAMERLMLREPEHWRGRYSGTADELRVQRHYSYADRIRYYWPRAEAQASVALLLRRLEGRRLPTPLISQYLGALYPAAMAGAIAVTAPELVNAAVRRVLEDYARACRAPG